MLQWNFGKRTTIGMLVYPKMTQLDFSAPFEVFSRIPGASVSVIAKSLCPVTSDTGLAIIPTATFEGCSQLGMIFVPGGPGSVQVMNDQTVLEFLRIQAKDALLITSVCTGSLVLAAAGLLRGHRATTHWSSMDYLALFGAVPEHARVVVDRNRITGAGVTAGLDFALTIAALIAGESQARAIQLLLEYDPQPPFDAGSPKTAGAELTAAILGRNPELANERLEAIHRAARRVEQLP